MSGNQESEWKKHAEKIHVDGIVAGYENPSLFQTELAAFINSICRNSNYSRVIEVGCESGTTNMLLENSLEKHFLDLNDEILEKVELACERIGVQGKFLHMDMFSMDCANESYDLVFNSGVVEHFDQVERAQLLKEYARILKPNGTMVLAIPNHYSLPYRSAYIVKKKLLGGYKWPWPEEYKIYNLSEEIEDNELRLVMRKTMAKQTVFNFWRFFRPVKWVFQLLDYFVSYEGYLTVLVIKKS